MKQLALAALFSVLAFPSLAAGTLPTPNIAALKINGVTQNFPSSASLAGTTDTQTLTNKSIDGSEVNSGIIPGAQGGTIGSVLSYSASGLATTTTGTISSSSTTLSLSGASGFVNGQGVLVNHAGAAFSGSITAPSSVTVTPGNSSGGGTTYCYQLASVDNAGGIGIATTAVCTSAGVATLGNHIAASLRSYNAVSWTAGTGTTYTAVWRNISGGAYCLLGEFNGTLIDDLVTTCQTGLFWIPTTPTVAALADWLQTTVSSGGGTTSLTLAATATTAASSTFIRHDDTAAITAAMSANTKVSFPCGTYPVTSISAPTTLLEIDGGGKDCAFIIGASGITTQLAGLADANILWATLLVPKQAKGIANISVTPLAPMAIGGIAHFGGFGGAGTGLAIHDVNVSGAFGVLCYNNNNDLVGPNVVVSNWWGYGIVMEQCTNYVMSTPVVGPIGGEAGGFYMSPQSAGLIGIGIVDALSSTGGQISNAWVVPFGGVFGISNQSANTTISNPNVRCSTHEGIAVAGTGGSHTTLNGGSVYWAAASTAGSTPAQCTSDDYGVSSANPAANAVSYVTISGLTVSNSWAAGIEVVSATSGGFGLDHFSIIGNTLNGVDAGLPSAGEIELSGCVTNSVVGSNVHTGSVAAWNVIEQTNAGCAPGSNTVDYQVGSVGTSGSVNIHATTTHYITRPALVAGAASY